MTTADAIARLEAIRAKALAEGRELTDSEEQEWQTIMTTTKQQPDPATLKAAEHPMPQAAGKKGPTFAQMLISCIALASGDRAVDTGVAKELDAETRRRNPWRKFPGVAVPLSLIMTTKAPISALPGGNAASTVGITWLDSLYYAIDAAIKMPLMASALGIETIAGTEETVVVPRLISPIVPQWVARDQPLAAADAAWDSVSLTPKELGCIMTLQRSALLYANHPNLAAIVPMEMESAMAREIDRAVLYGSGGIQPLGVVSQATAGGPLTTLASAYLIADELITYAKTDRNARWALPNLAIGKMNTTVAFTGATVAAVQGNTLAGYPIVMNQAAPDGAAGKKIYLFGDFSTVKLVVWDAVSILANPYSAAAFSSGGLEIRCIADANSIVLDPKKILKGDSDLLA